MRWPPDIFLPRSLRGVNHIAWSGGHMLWKTGAPNHLSWGCPTNICCLPPASQVLLDLGTFPPGSDCLRTPAGMWQNPGKTTCCPICTDIAAGGTYLCDLESVNATNAVWRYHGPAVYDCTDYQHPSQANPGSGMWAIMGVVVVTVVPGTPNKCFISAGFGGYLSTLPLNIAYGNYADTFQPGPFADFTHATPPRGCVAGDGIHIPVSAILNGGSNVCAMTGLASTYPRVTFL